MISLTCTSCRKKLSVKDELAGNKVKCPGCGKPVSVQAGSEKQATAGFESGKVAPPQPPGPEEPTLPPALFPDLAESATQPPRSPAGANRAADVAGGTTSAGGPVHAPAGHPAELTEFLGPPQAPDELGRLGGFRILKILGYGGMGVVFQGEDTRLGRKVAIKAMLPHLAGSKTSQDRFLREARSAAALEHDHIVPIFHVGEDRGVPFIAMPFLKGTPLDERLVQEPALTLGEVIRIGRETAEGLAAAHEQGLVHRDIKPANLWLEWPRDRVKILDFGLARAVTDDAQLTQQGAIVGTPAYMAPEQASGGAVDTRCDLFSLGCVLYRLATGKAPFMGTNTMSTLMSVANDEPNKPQAVNPEVPAALSDLVMQLLAKKPEDRPQSAREVAARLAALTKDSPPSAVRALENQPTREYQPRPVKESSTRVLNAAAPRTETIAPASPPSRTRRRPLVLLAVAVSLVLLTAAFVLIELFPAGADPGKDNSLANGGSEERKDDTTKAAASPLDNLDPSRVLVENRRRWQPAELVALLGDHHRRIHECRGLFISPDGKWLLCLGNSDFQLYETAPLRLRWDAYDFQETGGSTAAAFLADGKHFFRRNKLWDISGVEPKVVAEVKPEGVLRAAAARTKPLVAASYEDGFVRVFELAEGKLQLRKEFKAADADAPRHPYAWENGLEVVFADPAGQTLLTRNLLESKRFKIWDLRVNPPTVVYGANAPQVAISPDAKTMAVANQDGTTLWDLGETPPRPVPGWNVHVAGPYGLAFAPDSRQLLISPGNRQVDLWSVVPGRDKPLSTAVGPNGVAALSADGKVLFVFDTYAGMNGLRVFDAAGQDWKERPPPHTALGRPLFSHDGRMLWTLAPHGIHSLSSQWDLSGPGPVEKALPPAVESGMLLGWRANALLLLRENSLWSWKGDAAPPHLLIDLGPGRIHTGSVSRDGRWLAFTRETKPEQAAAEFWDLQAQPPRKATALEPTTDAHRMQFSADGKKLAFGGHTVPSRLFVLDGVAWKEAWKGPVTHTDGMVITAAGDRLATIANEIGIWDASSLPPRLLYNIPELHAKYADFSPDGRFLALGGGDKLAIYEAGTGVLKKAWALPQPAWEVAFAPDGRHLAVRNLDGCIWILRLNLPPAELSDAGK
jgi:serine/threonine protein kinase/WD40 repeat protein